MTKNTTASRSCCPLYSALCALGDRWTLIIIRELLKLHTATYSKLLGMNEKIATNTLADRLTKLQQAGIITKHESSNQYALTEKGIELTPALLELTIWAAKHDENSNLPEEATALHNSLQNDREAFLTNLKQESAAAQADLSR